MTNDGVNQYLYDGEGRVCAVASTPVPGFTTMTGYVYDADGNRVAKGTITNWSCDPSVNGLTTAGNETDYVLGPNGEQVTELAQDANGSMNWQRTYVHAGGALIATYDPVPNPQYNPAQYNPSNPTVDPPTLAMPSFRFTDWLGTMRASTDAYGVLQSTCTGLPFGDGSTCQGDTPDPRFFTGKERDAESGNDYFGARYFASTVGRFLTPDWSAKVEPVPYAKLDDPQSLNLYAYVQNNPLVRFDADGHAGPVNGNGNDPCQVAPSGPACAFNNWWKNVHGLITPQTFRRLALLEAPGARETVEAVLEQTRARHQARIYAYVLMPEHVHLLINEPPAILLAQFLKALKQMTSRKLKGDREQFWQHRYFDSNVYGEKARSEVIRYIHRNPVVRGLVEKPEEWAWSSFRHYATGVKGTVEIESEWTARRREATGMRPKIGLGPIFHFPP